MNDTANLENQKKKLERLKHHINAVLNLKPIERLSPLSVSILKTTKAFTDSIGAWAGSNGHLDGLDLVVLELLDAMKLNCTAEEVEVIQIALESFAWSYENSDFPFSLCPFLMGDEMFWTWEFLFMSDVQIRDGDESDGEKKLGRRRVVLKRFADLGIDVFEHGEGN